MNTVALLVLICLSGAFGVLQDPPAPVIHPPDKIIATRTLNGSFVGFEMGDYLHAEIRKSNGKPLSFFIGGSESLPYFLAANKDKQLLLTYQVLDSYIPEAGAIARMERLVAAKSGNETDQKWWKRISKSTNVNALRKKYDALVEQAMIR